MATLRISEGPWVIELQRTEGVGPQLGCVALGRANNCEPRFLSCWKMILCSVFLDAQFCAQASVYSPDDGMAKHLWSPRYIKIIFHRLSLVNKGLTQHMTSRGARKAGRHIPARGPGGDGGER